MSNRLCGCFARQVVACGAFIAWSSMAVHGHQSPTGAGAQTSADCERFRQLSVAIAPEIAQTEEQIKLTRVEQRKRALQRRLTELKDADAKYQAQYASCGDSGAAIRPPDAGSSPPLDVGSSPPSLPVPNVSATPSVANTAPAIVAPPLPPTASAPPPPLPPVSSPPAPPPIAPPAACVEPLAAYQQVRRDAAGVRVNVSALELTLGAPDVDPKIRADVEKELSDLKQRQRDVAAQLAKAEASLRSHGCGLSDLKGNRRDSGDSASPSSPFRLSQRRRRSPGRHSFGAT